MRRFCFAAPSSPVAGMAQAYIDATEGPVLRQDAIRYLASSKSP